MSVQNNDNDSHTKFQLFLSAVNRNILKNVQFYFIVFLAFFGIFIMKISTQNDILNKMKEDNVNANKLVIGLTTDGRVIGIEKTQIDASNLQVVIARAIRDNFIVGRRELTKNYTVSNFQSIDDLLKNSPRLKAAFDNYIFLGAPETLNDTDQKFQGEAASYFSAYLKYLLMELNDNNLPHFISVTDMNVVQFIPDHNKFSIRIQLPCQTESVGNDGKVVSQYGVNEIYAEGMFDISKGTKENPFGLKIIPKELRIVEIAPKTNYGN